VAAHRWDILTALSTTILYLPCHTPSTTASNGAAESESGCPPGLTSSPFECAET
jgi:hypothetical protein